MSQPSLQPVKISPDDLANLSPAQQRELLAKLLRKKAAKGNTFPMSAGQQGLWHAFRRDPNSTSFNVFLPTRIRSPLNLEALRDSINLLSQRHSSLRATFSDDQGELTQQIHNSLPPEYSVHEQLGASDQEIQMAIAEDVSRPFDLTKGPMIRMAVYKLAEDDWVVLALTHHIVVDFWSLVLILNEVRTAYPSYAGGKQPLLPEAQNNYPKFVRDQTAQLGGLAGTRQAKFWSETAASASGVLQLPTDRVRPARFTGNAANSALEFPDATGAQIQRLASASKATPFAIVHSVLQLLLSRYSGQDSFFVGSPFSGRGHREYEQTVGFFVNMLPLKADLAGDPSFLELVQRTSKTLLDALENETYPIARIVQDAAIPRDPSRSPLFQVSCTFEKAQKEQEAGRAGTLFPTSKQTWSYGGIQQEGFYVPHPTCHYDMEFIFELADARLQGMICYCRDLFDDSSVAALAQNFQALLQSALAAPTSPISQLPWRCDGSSAAASEFKHTAEYSIASTVHGLIETAASANPSSVVFKWADGETSYAQLMSQAKSIASHLGQRNIGAGDIIPVCCKNGRQAFTAMLGAQMAGAAVVPIDAGQPATEYESLMADTNAPAVLASRGSTWCHSQTQQLWIEDLIACDADPSWSSPTVTAGELAYVVYTSGSTGKPKGVMIDHGAVCNTLHWRMKDVPLHPGDRVLMLLSHQFDAGLGIAWTTLSQGASLVWADETARNDPACLIEQIIRDKITVLPAVPSLLRLLVTNPRFCECKKLRYIWTGGEVTTPELLSEIRSASDATFWNFYGPTEAAIEATACRLEGSDATRPVSIGHAIDNTQVLILDANRCPIPDTVPGEIAIAGRGLARGYLNQPELTAEKFIELSCPDGNSQRVYLTGDRGRKRTNGEIEFYGRTDHQVKIRGYRLELGEIESVIESHRCVQRAAVKVVGENQASANLIAFASLNAQEVALLPDASTHSAQALVRSYISEKLPAYKVPSGLAIVDEMPLTSSGKVDRKKLPDQLSTGDINHELVAPSTSIEEYLTQAWSKILDGKQLGVNQNFFDAGGSSLQAAMLTTQLTEDLGVHVPTALVFDLANVRQMSLRLVQLHETMMTQRFGEEAVANQLEVANDTFTDDTTPLHELIAPLHAAGHRRPIFMVHPPGGIVVCYRELAQQINSMQPLYGIRSRGLHGHESLPESIKEMAGEYLEAVKSVQSEGPYTIGGWSLGGLVAFEMAHQLIASGEQVTKLILLDTTIPEEASDIVPLHDRVNVGLEYGIELTLDQLGDLPAEEQLSFLWEHAKKLGVLDDDSPAEVVAQALEDLQNLFHHHVELSRQYRIQPTDVDVLLLRPTEVPFEQDVSNDRGWGHLTREVDVHFVPGHHHSMVQPPNVEHVAHIIDQQVHSL